MSTLFFSGALSALSKVPFKLWVPSSFQELWVLFFKVPFKLWVPFFSRALSTLSKVPFELWVPFSFLELWVPFPKYLSNCEYPFSFLELWVLFPKYLSNCEYPFLLQSYEYSFQSTFKTVSTRFFVFFFLQYLSNCEYLSFFRAVSTIMHWQYLSNCEYLWTSVWSVSNHSFSIVFFSWVTGPLKISPLPYVLPTIRKMGCSACNCKERTLAKVHHTHLLCHTASSFRKSWKFFAKNLVADLFQLYLLHLSNDTTDQTHTK